MGKINDNAERIVVIVLILAWLSLMLNVVLITELSNANELTDAYRDETVRIGNMYVCGEEEAYMAYLIAENFTVMQNAEYERLINNQRD